MTKISGRPRGSKNKHSKKENDFIPGQARTVRIEIRVTPAFKEIMQLIKEREPGMSDSDIIMKSVAQKVMARSYWASPAEIIKANLILEGLK